MITCVCKTDSDKLVSPGILGTNKAISILLIPRSFITALYPGATCAHISFYCLFCVLVHTYNVGKYNMCVVLVDIFFFFFACYQLIYLAVYSMIWGHKTTRFM